MDIKEAFLIYVGHQIGPAGIISVLWVTYLYSKGRNFDSGDRSCWMEEHVGEILDCIDDLWTVFVDSFINCWPKKTNIS